MLKHAFCQFIFCIFIFYVNKSDSSVQSSGKTELDGLGWHVYCKFQADSHDCRNNTPLEHRYYFDLKMQDCKAFLFGGCKYSFNTFKTMANCREDCRDTGLVAIKDVNVTAAMFCRFQPDFGDCNSYHPLFYYDMVHHRCRGFSYSGCGGNQNRFITKQACMAVCSGAQDVRSLNTTTWNNTSIKLASNGVDNRPEVERLDFDVFCKFQADTFNCEEIPSQKYYFDLKMEDCKPFLHGGCLPDRNQYDSMSLCRTSCRDKGMLTVTANLSSNIFCRFQSYFGKCQEYQPLWYYDITQHKCRGFSYSGCGGNGNRFSSYEHCMAICGSFRDTDKIRNYNNTSLLKGTIKL